MHPMRIFLIISLLIISPIASALELTGVFKQGGFIIGKTMPNASVTFNNHKTKASADGTFVFGITRNEKDVGEIKATIAGEQEKEIVFIEQRTYKIQKINGVPKRKVTPNKQDMVHIRADKKQILAARAIFDALPHINSNFIWPAKGKRSGVYGSRRVFNGEERSWHKGVDIAGKTGTPVVAPAGATVRLALADSFFNGNLVILDHGHQFMTIYAHLDSIDVKKGDVLKQGEKLGEIGQTGRATGPHLHWGLYWRNMALDPLLLVDKTKQGDQ